MSIVAFVAFFCALAGASTPPRAEPEFALHDAEDLRSHYSTPRQRPHLMGLHRESIPVRRKGKVVSYKSSYSGPVTLGAPVPQEFRVIFDTGSGQVIVPTLHCKAEPCLKHRRYNASASKTMRPVNVDGSMIDDSGEGDVVTIGFGTGQVTGDIIRERICIGPAGQASTADDGLGQESPLALRAAAQLASKMPDPCAEVHAVAATDMSHNPFSLFSFDGVVGLGLSALSLTANFSVFDQLIRGGQLAQPHFGFFIGGDRGEQTSSSEFDGELAIGGHNEARCAGPPAWAPVAMVEMGYWQVEIVGVYVDGKELDVCADGSCRGIVDTGTSHIGVPSAFNSQLDALLTRESGQHKDCREVDAPSLQIMLRSTNLTLGADSYMRRLPLSQSVKLGSGIGNEATPSAAATKPGKAGRKKWCTPKLTPVNFPAPLGPKLFILGEPVLETYYTVFDWSEVPRVGFSPVVRDAGRRSPSLRKGAGPASQGAPLPVVTV